MILDLLNKPTQTLLVLGSARSGTTWLAEIINNTQKYKYLFEPFHAGKATCWKGLDFYPIITEDDVTRATLRVKSLKKILNGRVKQGDEWVYGHGRQYKAPNLMIKAIRAQFMLPAIYKIKPEIKTIYIKRDLVDTISSQIKSGFPAPMKLLDSNKAKLVNSDDIKRFRQECGISETSMRVLKWSIENKVAIDYLKKNTHSLFINYEELKKDPQKQIKRILSFIESDASPVDIINASTRPSSTSALSRKNDAKTGEIKELQKISKKALDIFEL